MLKIEILREGFEIDEDDEAGLVIELHSDFLLSGVNIAIHNVATDALVEDERKDSSGRLVVGRLLPGQYELIIYTQECLTTIDPHGEAENAFHSFDLAMQISLKLIRLKSNSYDAQAHNHVAIEILDSGSLKGG